MDQQNPDNWFKGLPRPGMPNWPNRFPGRPTGGGMPGGPGVPGGPGPAGGPVLGGPSRMRRMVAMRPRRRRFGKREAIVLAVVFLLVAGTIGVLIKQSIDSAGDNKNGGTSKEQQAYDSAKSQSDQLSNSGDYDAEAKALEEYLKTNPSDQEHANEAQMRLAAAYTNAGEYDKAFSTYQLLDATPDPVYHRAGLHGKGTISALKGDKAAAVQYLSQLIQEYESSGDSPRQLSSTRAELEQIQGQQ